MNTEPRPARMYTDAERDARPRDLWDISHWIDWVEAGPSRPQRIARLADVPVWARAEVETKCKRRAVRAAAKESRDAERR